MRVCRIYSQMRCSNWRIYLKLSFVILAKTGVKMLWNFVMLVILWHFCEHTCAVEPRQIRDRLSVVVTAFFHFFFLQHTLFTQNLRRDFGTLGLFVSWRDSDTLSIKLFKVRDKIWMILVLPLCFTENDTVISLFSQKFHDTIWYFGNKLFNGYDMSLKCCLWNYTNYFQRPSNWYVNNLY